MWHLATTVNIERFSVELEAFAQQVGAGPTKQIVLVLDGAGWHDTPKVRVLGARPSTVPTAALPGTATG
jgi:hypothetical protein